MATCDECGKAENMPYNCRHCGGTYCADHRLPENHNCTGLENWNDPGGVFDSGFDDSVEAGSSNSSLADRIPIDTGPGSVFGYFRGNATYTFLALMWVTFLAQMLSSAVLSPELQLSIFYLTSWNPEYVWTWFTSIFAHGGFMHIVFNSIVIFFFGPLVERYVGSRKFALLFVVSGILAGLGQVAISLAQGEPAAILGASGAALAIMGVLTVLNPDLRVYIWFIIPAPIWALTILITLASVTGILFSGGFGGGIAHAAHLVGLLIGLGYGEYVKRTRSVRTMDQFQLGGGGPGGPGGPGRGRF